MGDVSSWSTTAGNNNSASPDGAPEGMAPSGVNNTIRENMRAERAFANDLPWFTYGDGDGASTIAYASATSFTVAGVDVTGVYAVGRPLRAVGSSTGTIYGIVTSSSFSTNTTVNAKWFSGSLSNESLTISIAMVGVGTAAAPRGGWQLLDTQTLSAVATADFTTLIGTLCDVYMFVIVDLRPAVDSDDLWMRLRDTTFQADATDYEYHTQTLGADVATYSAVNSEGDSKIRLTVNTGNASNEGVSGVVLLFNPSVATSSNRVTAQLGWQTNAVTPVLRGSNTIGHYNGAQNAVDGARFLFSSGNIGSGTILLYGLRK